MRNKKRAPLEQLKAAGRKAKQLLIERGVLAERSVIDDVMRDKHAPTLPGIPAYLPHQWTIKAAQQILYDMLIIWKDQCKNDSNKAEDITDFFKFLIKTLRGQEKEYKRDALRMEKSLQDVDDVPVLREVFSPMRKLETVKAIHRFFIDSFAVAVVVKNNHTTSEYANWFLTWTQDLYTLWVKPEERKNIKRV